MAGNFEGIKTRNFGIEIEMTGLTRCQEAKAISKVLGGEFIHEGGGYDKYVVRDSQNRNWSIVYDGSIKCYNGNGERASKTYSVEMNSPVLGYEDIPLLQEVVRALRKAGGVTGPRYCAGTHIHISADDYTPRQIRNLVNIFASKKNFLWEALQVSSARESYCHKMDKQFIEEINRKKPEDMEEIKRLWYHGRMDEQFQHYSNSRYVICNLHSFFQHGHYEIRAYNGSLHAGEVRSQMAFRCPHSKVVGVSEIKNFELEFRGVATIVPKENASIPVLIWELDEKNLPTLNRYEGYPNFYRQEKMEFELGGEKFECMAYLMNRGQIAPPSYTYYMMILQGYKENGLDESFLQKALDNSLDNEQKIQIEFDEEDGEDLEEDMDDDLQIKF